jgi:hypothetical protein
MDTLGSFPGASRLSMYVVQSMFLMFKHWFCWKNQYNKYMFNFIDHLHYRKFDQLPEILVYLEIKHQNIYYDFY